MSETKSKTEITFEDFKQEVLNDYNCSLAIYFIRLITSKSLTFSKKYISRIEKIKTKMRNPMQYWDKN